MSPNEAPTPPVAGGSVADASSFSVDAPEATAARPLGGQAQAARSLLTTVAATAVLAATAAAPNARILLIGVAVLQAALVLAWVIGTALPGRIGGLVLAVCGCAAADASVLAWPTSELSPLLAPLGLAILAMFVHQLTRGVVRARVVESLAGIAMVLVTAIALAAFVQLRHEFSGRDLAISAVFSAGGAIVTAMIIDLVWSKPRLDPAVPRGVTGLAVGTGVGTVLGRLMLSDVDLSDSRKWGVCVIIGLLATLATAGTGFVTHALTTQRNEPVSEFAVVHQPRPVLRPFIEAVLPLALVAPAAYVLFLSAS